MKKYNLAVYKIQLDHARWPPYAPHCIIVDAFLSHVSRALIANWNPKVTEIGQRLGGRVGETIVRPGVRYATSVSVQSCVNASIRPWEFCFLFSKLTAETIAMLMTAGDAALSKTKVHEWFSRFKYKKNAN